MMGKVFNNVYLCIYNCYVNNLIKTIFIRSRVTAIMCVENLYLWGYYIKSCTSVLHL